MDSTAHGRKERAQDQSRTPPEHGDTAPGTWALRDFRDQKVKTAPANRHPRLAGWAWGGQKSKKSEKT